MARLKQQFDVGSTIIGLGYDTARGELAVYRNFDSGIERYSLSGSKIGDYPSQGGSANDYDLDGVDQTFTMDGTTIPFGSMLIFNGESNALEIYAVNPATGALVATLQTDYGVSHVVGGAYNPFTGTFFVVQDSVPGDADDNQVAEIDPATGAVLQTFDTDTQGFDVFYGDIEVDPFNGDLWLVSSSQGTMQRMSTSGQVLGSVSLPQDVVSLSGIAFNPNAPGEVWVASTNGRVSLVAGLPTDQTGTANAETLRGGEGNDRLTGLDGDDTLIGNEGNDTLNGGAGNDGLNGGLGADRLFGKEGDDTLSGGDGNDAIYGGFGDDNIAGGEGDDILSGNAGVDSISGQAGNDTIFGGGDADGINGGSGNDTLYGQAGNDQVQGASGNDTVNGGGGNDSLDGGIGDDRLIGSAGNDVLRGGDGADNLNGGSGTDSLFGDAGNDLLNGFIGNDVLRGGDGNDRIRGGDGDDVLFGDAGTDTFAFDAGWGDDRIADFADDGLEKIDFRNIAVIDSIADLTITDTASGALIEYGANSILLTGITAAQLDASDFLFSG